MSKAKQSNKATLSETVILPTETKVKKTKKVVAVETEIIDTVEVEIVERATVVESKREEIEIPKDAPQILWQVKTEPVQTEKGIIIPTHKLLTRSDNGEYLNLCKKSYTPLQNSDFNQVVYGMSKITGYPVEMVDELAGGKKVMAFLKCTDPIQVGGFDFKDYLLIGNSHDGGTPFFMGNSSMMVRCENRFTAQMQNLKAIHTTNIHIVIDEIMSMFEEFIEFRKLLFDTLEDFREVPIPVALREALAYNLSNISEQERNENKIHASKVKTLDMINRSFDKEIGDLGMNLFGLFNGVTHFTTHSKIQKNETAFNVFGAKADWNNFAFNVGCDVLDLLDEGNTEKQAMQSIIQDLNGTTFDLANSALENLN